MGEDMRRGFLRVRAALGVFVLLWLALAPALPCWGEAAVLRVQHRSAAEILPIVKDLLSADGRAAVDVQSNSLIIVDNPESIGRIQSFLQGIDKPVPQVSIRVRFYETDQSRGRSGSAEGAVSGENWRVSTGRRTRDGVEVRVHDQNLDRKARSEYFIRVASGNWAYILVGKEIPFSQRWVEICRRYARIQENVVIQRIETGVEVRPILLADRAEVEIMPRISHEAPGRERGVVRFASTSSTLSVPLGQWTDVGGTDSGSDEVIRAILESGSSSRQSSLRISFVVEAVH